MTDHLLLVREDEAAHAAQPPDAIAALIDARAQFAEQLRRSGWLVDAGRLRPSREGRRVRQDGDRRRVEDGPFTEDGRALGAFYWLSAGADPDELARACPALPSDEVELRPVMRGRVGGHGDGLPGKVFAFAVLGNAATEAAWVQTMDRIDAEATATLAAADLEAPLVGGVRLQPPTAGRRVVQRGARRAVLDGPFLECKEVIGGLFLRRLASLEDAVRWAGESSFVRHGALEIRELWRC